MNFIIRKKTIDDCENIVKIITTTWRETYKGIVNDDFLDKLLLNEDKRIVACKNKFDENDNNVLVLEINKQVVGFVKYGNSNYKNYENSGEIFSLYIKKEFQKKGYGKALFLEAIENLKKLKYNTLIVGCLDKNEANEFYKHLGGIKVGTRYYEKTGEKLLENVYYFDISL